MTEPAVSLATAIRERARELGFDAVGFARADEPLDEDHRRYLEAMERGYHGDMAYLADHAEVRRSLDNEGILPGARTVVCLARRYDRDESADPPVARLIARYARGRDYHGFLRKRVARLAAFVRTLGDGVLARAFIDTAPLLERAWAARAGIGFVGKNGLLIVPGQGSYCLLGEVVTTLPLADADYGRPMGERCGSCTACLDACPTDAFDAPYVLDPRRCVSYRTIERRSPAPPGEPPPAMLFGCDDCQAVCPYNRVRPPPAERTAPFAPLDRWHDLTLADLAHLDEPAFLSLTEHSPLRRAGHRPLTTLAGVLAEGDLPPDAGTSS